MNLLHIHQDYPDGRPYSATKAVSNLIDSAKIIDPSVKHFVLSINRTSNPFKISIKNFEDGISLVYWSLPLPFISRLSIVFWCNIIYRYLRKSNFDKIHAHKLTTEGMFAFYLSKKMELNYSVSIRGGSDLHNINRLKDCNKLFKKIFLDAENIFWVSVWAKKSIEDAFNIKVNSATEFPNICHIEKMSPARDVKKKRYCTILNFDQYHRKGVVPLIHAISNLNRNGYEIKLDIIGGGNQKNKQTVNRLITELKLESSIQTIGVLDSEGISKVLQNSRGLLLPSVNETFGMVYVEAAACGCPFLYVNETGIDGYFDNLNNSIKISDQNIKSIEKGIVDLENERNMYLSSALNMASSGELKRFQKAHIAKTYLHKLKNIN